MNVFCRSQFLSALILIAFSGFSQNVAQSSDSKYDRLGNGRWNPAEYLWSYAKSKVAKSDKSLIDFTAIDNWQRLGDYLAVSPNGRYFAYTIELARQHLRADGIVDSLIVQSIDNPQRRVFAAVKPGFFTRDSRIYVSGSYIIQKNSIHYCFAMAGRCSISCFCPGKALLRL